MCSSDLQKDSIDEFFEDIKFLTSFSGCKIFDIIETKKEHLFYTKNRGCDAVGFYHSSGFTVLKDSIIAKGNTNSFSWSEKREKLIKEYAVNKDGKLVIESDITFSSPSTAADFCLGRTCNGWLIWKDKEEQTLDSIYRKQLE